MELDDLKVPQFDPLRHSDIIREPILQAQRSASLGFWLVLPPVFFIACLIMKYIIGWNVGLIQNFEDFLAALDRDRLGHWLQPLVMLVAPAAAVVLNLLAVLHIRHDKQHNELIIRLKLRWWNLLFVVVGLGILAIFLLYAIGEAYHHAS